MIFSGLPYFYQEDEAHHYNRSVNMVKSGDLNPHYFHKPSLHFYLRMPVVALSFINEVREGRAKSLKEIRTRDIYGLGDYAFTASHPGMVKWNRALSVSLSLLLICFVFLVCQHLGGSTLASSFAALVCAFSPDLIEHSAVVGVDTLMACMCAACIWLLCQLDRKFSPFRLFLLGLFAGLAISSKYNAAPILLLPFASALLLGDDWLRDLSIAFFAPVLGFFLGSPYILSSIPLFLDQLAYEVWHYGIAGHEGHSASPGLEQALFYAHWLNSSAVGAAVLALAALGGLFGVAGEKRRLLFLISLFPICFAALMISQKANFTRNMLALIPFLAIFAAYPLALLGRLKWGILLALPLFVLALVLPVKNSRDLVLEVLAQSDSRDSFAEFIRQAEPQLEKGIAGQLLVRPELFSLPNTTIFNQETESPASLYLLGYDQVSFGNREALSEPLQSGLKLEREFAGTAKKMRVVKDPQIWVYRFEKEKIHLEARKLALASNHYQLSLSNSGPFCVSSSSQSATTISSADVQEPHCWTQSRISKLLFTGRRVQFEAMSPWPDSLSFRVRGSDFEQEFRLDQAGHWKLFELVLPEPGPENLTLEIDRVRAPRSAGLNDDPRRLGLALRPPSASDR